MTTHNTKQIANMDVTPKSRDLFKLHWHIWQILGINTVGITWRYPYMTYSLLLNTIVTLGFPLSICLGIILLPSSSTSATIQMIAVGAGCVNCSLKFMVYMRKLRQVRAILQLMDQLDARIDTAEDRAYFGVVRARANLILNAFKLVCSALWLFFGLSILLKGNRNLFQPAWLPFDYRSTALRSLLADLYQFMSVTVLILQNFSDDTFTAMVLCLLSGHIKLLGMRAARIGYDRQNQYDPETALRACVHDHKTIYKLLVMVQEVISLPVFFQFATTLFNVCMVLAALLFFLDTTAGRLFYASYLFAQQLEIFPVCYYGSAIEVNMSELHRSIYACNWIEQSQRFRKHMMLFVERSLKQSNAIAVGMYPIHLTTFFSTLRTTYSLFAIVIKLR